MCILLLFICETSAASSDDSRYAGPWRGQLKIARWQFGTADSGITARALPCLWGGTASQREASLSPRLLTCCQRLSLYLTEDKDLHETGLQFLSEHEKTICSCFTVCNFHAFFTIPVSDMHCLHRLLLLLLLLLLLPPPLLFRSPTRSLGGIVQVRFLFNVIWVAPAEVDSSAGMCETTELCMICNISTGK